MLCVALLKQNVYRRPLFYAQCARELKPDDRLYVVIGASTGIGRACAQQLMRRGRQACRPTPPSFRCARDPVRSATDVVSVGNRWRIQTFIGVCSVPDFRTIDRLSWRRRHAYPGASGCTAMHVDLADKSSVRALAEQLRALGKPIGDSCVLGITAHLCVSCIEPQRAHNPRYTDIERGLYGTETHDRGRVWVQFRRVTLEFVACVLGRFLNGFPSQRKKYLLNITRRFRLLGALVDRRIKIEHAITDYHRRQRSTSLCGQCEFWCEIC